MDTIERITSHAELLRRGDGPVRPGEPYTISEAVTQDDEHPQGDVYIRRLEGDIPSDYRLVQECSDADRQLVPGETEGARHCLDSLVGVDALYRPAGWGPSYDELLGPIVVLSKPRVITHPKHGDMHVPVGTWQTGYQRSLSADRARERRNAD